MKTSKAMQEIVAQLAQKHGLDLNASQAYLRLEMLGFDRLVIEKISSNLIKLAHYYERDYHLIADPEIIFFMADATWIPIEITQAIGGHRVYAVHVSDGRGVILVDQHRQADLAEFVEMWACNLKGQKWLEHGVKWDPCDPTKAAPPDEDTLMRWEAEGGCEAVDGCWVEPDGRCEHGCSSWLLELGWI